MLDQFVCFVWLIIDLELAHNSESIGFGSLTMKNAWLILIFFPDSVATLKGFLREQLRLGVQSRWYRKRPTFSP